MWADVLTKPLQGHKFCLFRSILMNCPVDYSEDSRTCYTTVPTLAPTLSSPVALPRSSTFLPTFPSSSPTDNPLPMKPRVLIPSTKPSLRGCVGTSSHGTVKTASDVPRAEPVRSEYRPTSKKVSWRDQLFPRHAPPAHHRVESFGS